MHFMIKIKTSCIFVIMYFYTKAIEGIFEIINYNIFLI